jgi:hypothetical protein
VTRLLLASCALAVLACARTPAPDGADAPPVRADTLRGTVRIAGSEPMTSRVLEPSDGGPAVTLEGERTVLERLAGIEVAVEGEPAAAGRFRVTRVHVRAANGVPAVDGVLARDGGRDVLVLGDGSRRVITTLPRPLRTRTGAWIWLAGPLDGDIDSFGVIADSR